MKQTGSLQQQFDYILETTNNEGERASVLTVPHKMCQEGIAVIRFATDQNNDNDYKSGFHQFYN